MGTWFLMSKVLVYFNIFSLNYVNITTKQDRNQKTPWQHYLHMNEPQIIVWKYTVYLFP